MDKLALALAVIGIGLGAYAAFGTPDESGGAYDATSPEATGEIASLRAEVAALRDAMGSAAMRADVASAGAGGTLSGRSGGMAPLSADIEARFDAQDKRMAAVEAQAEAAGKTEKSSWGPSRFLGKSRFLANLDMAEKELKLDSGQRAQFERVIEGTKAELDRLFDTPDDEGQTLRELMKPTPIKLDGGDGEDLAIRIMGNFGKMRKFKKQKVPGTNETYAQAERRIRDGGKRDARNLLNDDQAKKWDNSHTDSLFGSGAVGGAFISVEASSDVLPFPGK